MENLLRDGDYVPNGFGGFTRLYGTQEVLAMPFLPELGSRLYELGKEKPSGRQAMARLYCAQALSGMGLEIEDVTVTELSNGHASIELWLVYQDERQAVEVRI